MDHGCVSSYCFPSENSTSKTMGQSRSWLTLQQAALWACILATGVAFWVQWTDCQLALVGQHAVYLEVSLHVLLWENIKYPCLPVGYVPSARTQHTQQPGLSVFRSNFSGIRATKCCASPLSLVRPLEQGLFLAYNTPFLWGWDFCRLVTCISDLH